MCGLRELSIRLPNRRDPVIKRATVNRDQCVECYACFNPVNLGDARNGGALRPSRSMNPFSHWRRDIKPNFRAVVDGFTVPTRSRGVRQSRRSGGLDESRAGRGSGIERQHFYVDRRRGAVLSRRRNPPAQRRYSLGFEGKTEHLAAVQPDLVPKLVG